MSVMSCAVVPLRSTLVCYHCCCNASADGSYQPAVAWQPPAKRRYKKDPAAPKKYHSAYICFLMDHRKNLPQGTHVVDGTAQTAAAWHALSPAERAVYEQRAQQERDQWQKVR